MIARSEVGVRALSLLCDIGNLVVLQILKQPNRGGKVPQRGSSSISGSRLPDLRIIMRRENRVEGKREVC
jgi:hypothetical protein